MNEVERENLLTKVAYVAIVAGLIGCILALLGF